MELTNLHLETLGGSATTSTLELASLGSDLWLLVGVWAETEALDSLSGVLWSAEEDGVGSGWGSESELVEGEGLTTGSENSGTGSGGELQGGNGELWDGKSTVVVSDGTDNDNGLAMVGWGVWVGGVSDDSRERDWWAVDLGGKESAQDNLVEWSVGSTGEEPVQLDEESQVDIVTLWRLAMVRWPLVVQINTHRVGLSKCCLFFVEFVLRRSIT